MEYHVHNLEFLIEVQGILIIFREFLSRKPSLHTGLFKNFRRKFMTKKNFENKAQSLKNIDENVLQGSFFKTSCLLILE